MRTAPNTIAGIASFGDVVRQTGFSDALILSLKLAVITTVLTMALMVPTTIYVHLRLPRLRRRHQDGQPAGAQMDCNPRKRRYSIVQA